MCSSKHGQPGSAWSERTVKETMAALYFDINCVCIVRDMTSTSISQDDINWYRSEDEKAAEFVGRAVALMLN